MSDLDPELLAQVDPELRDGAIAAFENRRAFDPMTYEKLLQRRAGMAAMAPEPDPDVPFEKIVIDRGHTPDDPGEVVAYLVNPKPGANGPGILHIHGGGYTASTAIMGIVGVQRMARALDCPILTVEYRLAPETRWTSSLEDNYAALLWLARNGNRAGVDPARIALSGESAGGGHAALLAFAARDRGEVMPAFQLLTYPMLDDRAGTTRPASGAIGYFVWNGESNRFGWESFLGQTPGGDDVPVAAIPARRDDLAGLPPAYICCGALDLFVDENIDYARRLNHAGVPVELLIVPGAYHGFDSFAPQAAISQRFFAARVDALRRWMTAGEG